MAMFNSNVSLPEGNPSEIKWINSTYLIYNWGPNL